MVRRDPAVRKRVESDCVSLMNTGSLEHGDTIVEELRYLILDDLEGKRPLLVQYGKYLDRTKSDSTVEAFELGLREVEAKSR